LRPHLVSSGLVLLAHLAEPERERYLAGRLEAATPKTTTDPAALRRRLDEVAARGTAWTIDEFVTGIGSVAAAVTGPGGRVLAAVHVHGPSYRFPPPGAEDEVAAAVAAAAARISTRLSSGPADEPA
jgi:DNA-binding IclR family transcriptional regulator